MAREGGERGAEDRRGCRQEKAAREERREEGEGPGAAEVVPPLQLLALCAARGRDGPRPSWAVLRRAVSLPHGGRGQD